MDTNSSVDKDLCILMFLGGILVGFLLIQIFLIWSGKDNEKNEVITNQVVEITQLTDKPQRFSVNGSNIKTATVCFEGKQMLFVFYRGEPQIINLNKDCGETK
jgi:hypothetical protein